MIQFMMLMMLMRLDDAAWVQIQKSYTSAVITDNGWYVYYGSNSGSYSLAAGVCNSAISSPLVLFKGGTDYAYGYYTVVSTIVSQTSGETGVDFLFFPYSSSQIVGIRNILIYSNACHPTCKTCSGPNQNQCLSCYSGSVTSEQCLSYPGYKVVLANSGWVSECPRNYYIANSNFICVSDRRIILKLNYFTDSSFSSITPFILITDMFHQSNRIPINGYYRGCSQRYCFGSLFYKEGSSLQLSTINALQFIRLRITFNFLNLQLNSKIRIVLDGVQQAVIQRDSSSYSFSNILTIFQETSNCYSPYQALIRIETILRTSSLSPLLVIQGQLNSASESWGFRDVNIDAGLCSEHCQVCSGFTTCSTCDSGYRLYQNGCVTSCPMYSQNCIGCADEYPYSRYLVKGFYDMNMTLDDVNMHFDSVTNENMNFKTGQKFGFFPDKFVLGGVMVWNDASYIKAFIIPDPHYAISIRFNMTFGDEYSGEFYYSINSVQAGPFTLPSTGQNIVGQAKQERTSFFYKYLNPYLSTTLNIELKCVNTASIIDYRDGFCAISEYFIVVHYCPPFCDTCTSDTICTTWQAGHTSSQCESDQYLSFDSTSSTYICDSCSAGCLTCNSQDECLTCDEINNFYLFAASCQCLPHTIQSGATCIPCNKHCQTCDGPDSYKCSCISQFYRSISNSQCVCLLGYYDDGVQLPCLPICGDGIKVDGEDCDDGNLYPFDGCDQCKFSCSRNCDICVTGQCVSCLESYELIGNECFSITQYHCLINCVICLERVCLQCNEDLGYYLNDKTNQCLSLCGDGIISGDEQCDDGNSLITDGCADCKFECHEKCSVCTNGQCYKCQGFGWELNLVTRSCQTNCGDHLVAGSEICDDGNDYPEDGCYECQFECQKSCKTCTKGHCTVCIDGWEFGQNEKDCVPVCGDSLVISDYEECDDGNTVLFDGCFQCKYQCQEECTDCQKGICYACNTQGWDIANHLCYPVCGDGYLIKGFEECDDGNQEKFDGCYECRYQCEELCTSCSLGICYDCNHSGWIITNHVCTAFCGDGLVLGSEQCDDMNQFQGDGCFECKFVCDEHCINCKLGICYLCEDGRFETNNACKTLCGDGYFVKLEEQCDDSNLDNFDGCSEYCTIETDYMCSNAVGLVSKCGYSRQPEFSLQLLEGNSVDVESVLLTFTQQMQWQRKDGLAYILTNITNMESGQFEIATVTNEKIYINQVNNVTITFTVKFFAPIVKPLLSVKFVDNPIISEHNQTLKANQNQIQLSTPNILSKSQLNIAQAAQAFNQAVIYSLIALSSVCLLTGSSDLFWNLMDQLQYLSYIKYINIQFPNNVNIYFEVFKIVTISPLISALRLDVFFSMIDGGKEYFVLTSGKFLDDEINAYFFINFQSFIFCFFSGFAMYYLTKQSYLLLYKVRPCSLCRLNLFVSKIYYKLMKMTKKQTKQFYYNGILRIMMSNCYDLTFSAAIQLMYYQIDDYVLLVNYYLALLVVVGQLVFTLFVIGVISKFFRNATTGKKMKYDALFEEVLPSKNIWSLQFNSVLLLKKQIFIFILVFMQQQGQLQTLFIALLQSLFLSYLLIHRPLKNRFELYKTIISEFLLIFNAITFSFYAYQNEIQFTPDQIVVLGWIHIFSSTMVLGVSFIIDFIQQVQILIQKIKQSKKPPVEKGNGQIVFYG